VGVWDRILTQTEIDDLYNGGAGLAYPLTVAAGDPEPQQGEVWFNSAIPLILTENLKLKYT